MKNLLKNVSVASILTAIVGLVLLIMPTLTDKIIVNGIGLVLLVYGAFRIIRYMRSEATEAMIEHDLSIGLICAVSGLFMLVYSEVVISILPFLYGLFLIYGGARCIQTAFDVRRFHGSNWTMHLIIGIVFGIVGIIVIRNPFSTAVLLTRFIGLSLVVQGIYMFIANKKVNDLRRDYQYGSHTTV